MQEENRKDKLKELRKRLYTKGFKGKPVFQGKLSSKEYKVNNEWDNTENTNTSKEKEKSEITANKIPMIKKIFIGSVIFFILALGFVAFTFYRGSNVISADNINIEITGPVSVKGGEEFELGVNIKNKSETDIESASLLIEYPKGAYESFDSQDELVRTRKEIGTVSLASPATVKIPLVLFGEENSEKEINFTLEFRFKGSGATLEKSKVYNVRISSSPVNLSFFVPKEASIKQEFDVVVDIESNSNNPIKDLLVKVEYPFGFVFKGASPSASIGENIWHIGDLLPSDKKTIKIRGAIDGQEGDEKVFRVSIGTSSKESEDSIGTLYNFVSESIYVTKPFLGINLLVDGNASPEYVSKSGKSIRVDILWESNIPTRIIDGQIKVKLNGDVLDKFSVLVSNGGFYRSSDNTIIWDKRNNSNLSVIESGEKGSVNFTFKPLPLVKSNGGIFEKPEISIDVSASGKRISDTNVPEEVTTSIGKNIRVESDLAIIPRVVYYTGPFKNTGSLPPVADKQTTYTVVLTVTNSSNNASNVVARTTLPTYVKWLGVVSPSDEDISFNEAGGEIVWNVGNVERGAGITSAAREVAFQIGLLPSVSQIGKVPLLTGKITLTGTDSFTNTVIKETKEGLSTRLSTDPYFKINQALVTY